LSQGLEKLNIHLDPVDGELPSFETLHHKWPDFFRKGKVNAWREELPKDLHELFWRHNVAGMEYFDYSK
jgi:hypothetical protein